MEKEFIPYDRALKLKELGFKESCFGMYCEGKFYELYPYCSDHHPKDIYREVDAPTFSQAFRWFREENELFSKVYIVNFGSDEYCFRIYDLFEEKAVYDNFSAGGSSYCGTFDTYEEAELACLDKLIEIVESKSE